MKDEVNWSDVLDTVNEAIDKPMTAQQALDNVNALIDELRVIAGGLEEDIEKQEDDGS